MEVLTIPMTPFLTNCYVVRCGKEALVIDPGDVTEDFLTAIRGLPVAMIVNTHGHCDHCGGNAELKRQTGAPLAIHREDLPLLQSIREQGALFGVPFPDSPMPDVFLDENDTIAVGDVIFHVLHTPGHSPGHISLVTSDAAFVGDVVFSGSVGRTDLPGGSQAQLMESITKKILTLGDPVVLYPGHGSPTSVADEKRSNPFLTSNGWRVL